MNIYVPRNKARWLCTTGLVGLISIGFSIQAMAQDFHGVAVAANCESPSKVGETVSCSGRFRNEDDFGDTHRVKEFWGVVDPAGLNIRVPAVGNAPITAKSAGTECTPAPVGPDAPIGWVFPCDVPGESDFVTISDTFEVPDVGSELLEVQARLIEQDLCDSPTTTGCSTLDNRQEQPAAINLFEPSLNVTKNGPAAAKVGDEITYTIGFENTSTGTFFPGFENCTGSDTVLGDLGSFDPAGETKNFLHTVSADDPNPLVNTATITCGVVGFNNQVSDSDGHSLDWINPEITATKNGPANAKVGDVVTYTIGFANTGLGAVENCTGSDTVLGDLGAFEAGVDKTFDHTVSADDPNPLVNTASITCDVAGFDNQVSDSDGHSLDWINPEITVNKNGPANAKVGDVVTYTIGFANTGLGAVENCTGSDTVLGDLGAFEAGVDKTFDHTVSADDPNPLVNTASITCDVAGFDNQVSDSDGHSLDWINPEITVTKNGPANAKVGDVVTYTIGFANTGAGAVESCTGTDTVLGDLGAFEAGVDKTFDHTVSADDPNPLVNTATITCGVAGFDNQVSDSDGHSLDWINPEITVTKNGPATAKVGDVVTYTIGFANTGAGAVENCTGTDTVLGDLGAFEPDVDRTFDYTVDPDDPSPLVNEASITCDVAGFDNQVSDSDDHSLDLINPSVSIEKLCRPDPVAVGESIEWEITVTNTGDAGIECLVNDAEAGISDEPLTLAAAESDTLNASRIVESGETLISNTATVDCTIPGFDNQLSDEASADCEVTDELICRTPGFWGTHAGDEKRRSSDLVQTVIDAAGGSLSVCGQTIDNTDVGNMMSAVEAMCVRIEGEQQRQLARQLTAMALNCVVSGGNADCSGTSVEGLFADANASCAADDDQVNFWIGEVDAFNNGIDCQARELDESTDIFDGIRPLPGPAGSSGACRDANGNGIKVVPVDAL